MKRFIFLLLLLGCLDAYSQKAAIRVNALSAIDGAFGGGISYAIGNKSTVELTGSLRPWKRNEEYVNRYWLLQPEYKYWTCQKYNGLFWGGYLNGAKFNIGGKKLPFGIFSQLKRHRYEGWLAGGGISCGYHWMLNDHWNIETSVGVGYEFIHYRQYNCVDKCAKLREEGKYHYVEIARKHRSTPWRVYHLGHGGRGKTLKDMRILEELQQYGIISHIYPW